VFIVSDREFDAEIIDAYLRYLRGRGPRPEIEQLHSEEQTRLEKLFELLDAIVDSDEIEVPPIEKDPVALRLGIVSEKRESSSAASGIGDVATTERSGIDPALAELAHRFRGEVEFVPDDEMPIPEHDAGGLLPAHAVCVTLGEEVLVCVTDREDLSVLLRDVALVFVERPAVTAVTVASTVSFLGVVLREADCVRAIDPKTGWLDPGLPRQPEPLELALGRYLDETLPRWDEVARLEDVLRDGDGEKEVGAAVYAAMKSNLSRTFKIPAKSKALEELQDIPLTTIQSVVTEIRESRLFGDGLIERVSEVSDVSIR
jgi:hypothetical protein